MTSGILIKRLTLCCLASYALLLFTGCAETPQFDDVWENDLKGCAFQCHSPDGTASDGPDMSTQDKFYVNVIEKTVANNYSNWLKTSDCDTLQLVKPGDAANSSVVASLVQSVSDAQTCDTAFSFHVGQNVTNTANNWTNLVKWIDDGAKKD